MFRRKKIRATVNCPKDFASEEFDFLVEPQVGDVVRLRFMDNDPGWDLDSLEGGRQYRVIRRDHHLFSRPELIIHVEEMAKDMTGGEWRIR